MNMSLEEKNDFFVERKLMSSEESEEKFNVVCAQVIDNDIVTKPRDYMPTKDFRISDNISRIRIPSALFIRDETFDNCSEYLILNYKKQMGAHLMVNSKGYLCYVYTNLNVEQNESYVVSPLRYINDVYPCFVNHGSKHKMGLGLRFTTETTKGFRSFSRSKDNLISSCGVFDLTENILQPKRLTEGINSDTMRALFSKGKYHYAIYVCDGAKMIVEEERFFQTQKRETLRKTWNVSLFQSGSMVIFSGDFRFQMSYSLTEDQNGEYVESCKAITLNECHRLGLIRPEDGLFQHWFEERRLHLSKERVILLGHNYSVHNSICWRLRINYMSDNSEPIAVLCPPEGCRIVDLQRWDRGMAEIYWRHCFERLYEKVLFPMTTELYIQSNSFHYFIPTIRGKNTHFWERKILGVDNNFNSWIFDLKHNNKEYNKEFGSIPPYYEQYLDWCQTVTPFAPPLHPPIYCDRHFFYLPNKICPHYMNNQIVLIRGQTFKIKYISGVEEYQWIKHNRVSVYQNNSFSTNERLGIDLMVYKRVDTIIGRKIMFYFEFWDSEPINSKEMFPVQYQIRQWIKYQNSGHRSDNIIDFIDWMKRHHISEKFSIRKSKV